MVKRNAGKIVVIGGAEDRKYDLMILRSIVELNKANSVAVIPTATDYPGDAYDSYRNAFRKIGVNDVHYFDVRDKNEASDPRYLDLAKSTDLFFFTGGDQEKLARILLDTPLLLAIRKKQRKGATIAGTSAGAAAIGNPMISGGSGYAGLKKGAVRFSNGFGIIDGLVIDTHFMERERIPRLAQVLSSGKANMGIGLGEDTAAIFTSKNQFKVIGSEVVVVLTSQKLKHTDFHEVGWDQKFAADNLQLSFLTDGMEYDLKKRKILHSADDIQN